MSKTKKLSDSRYIFVLGALVIATVFVTIFASHKIFEKNTDKELKEIARMEELQFYNGLNAEMALSNQLAKSPLIVSYMENPEDETLSSLAFKEIDKYQQSFASHITFWIGDKDLNYYSNGNYIYTLDKSDPSSEWYNVTMNMKADYALNVDYDIGLNVTNLWVNAIVNNGQDNLGLIGTGIGLTDFVNKMFESLDSNYKMFLYNNDLQITGSTDIVYMENKTPVTDVLNFLSAEELKVSETKLISKLKGEFIIVPIEMLDWNILIFRPYDFKNFVISGLIPFTSMVILILVVVAVIVIGRLLNPLKILAATIEGIASGNADLTKRISLEGKSSASLLNRLVDNFNLFIGRLQNIISTVKESKEELVQYGDLLNCSTEDTSGAISEISSNLDALNLQLENQSSSVHGTASAMHQISANIDSLNNVIEIQDSSVQTASTAIEQMLGNIKSVNNSVEKLSSSFGELEKQASNGVQKQQEVTNRIELIRQQSEALQNANEVISAIAEQTNLLAMNAAIEAAHAGDAGKGFSVVADEIRKLSETSAEQSNTIGIQLSTIQESILSIVTASEESQDALQSVSENINSTNQLVQQIQGAMGEQEAGSKQINIALSDLNNNMREVKGSSYEMAQGNASVLKEVQVLQEATFTMKDSMHLMNGSAQKISSTGSNLEQISQNLEHSIKAIGQQIDQFKV